MIFRACVRLKTSSSLYIKYLNLIPANTKLYSHKSFFFFFEKDRHTKVNTINIEHENFILPSRIYVGLNPWWSSPIYESRGNIK